MTNQPGSPSAMQDTKTARDSATQLAVPVLPAWQDGREVRAWCDHCGRWHVHGGPGRKTAHCVCARSPYKRDGYIVAVQGPWTAELAERTEGWQCIECAHDKQCSCGRPRCPEDWLCAAHADQDCGSCWAVHGGPGFGRCHDHGMVQLHPHPRSTARCQAGDDLSGCVLAAQVMKYQPAGGAAQHAHCPACWAAATLRARDESFTMVAEPPPPCKGCRKLLTPAVLDRVGAQLEAEAFFRSYLRASAHLFPAPDQEAVHVP